MITTKRNEDLFVRLKSSLEKDGSSANNQKWARYIIKNDIPLKNVAALIKEDGKAGMHFSWMLGYFSQHHPEVIRPCITYFYNSKNNVKFKGFNRSLAKMFFYCGIPDKIEGSATNDLFNWLLSADSDVSTKSYCIMALEKACYKHEGLKQEFRVALEDQLGKNSATFRKKAMKILSSLNDQPTKTFRHSE
jgi:hypothetical protein